MHKIFCQRTDGDCRFRILFAAVVLAILLATPFGRAGSLDLKLLGSWPGHGRGPAYSVSVTGNRAYLAAGGGGLIVLDVADPTMPRPLGGAKTRDNAID